VPLEVNKVIVPGEIYHLRIAITDAGDGILDSGVFLEECAGCDYNVGVDDQTFDDFLCFPNPTTGGVNLSFPVLDKNLEMSVYSATDKQILTTQLRSRTSEINFNLSETGVYIVYKYI
jgi:hypothetical protein